MTQKSRSDLEFVVVYSMRFEEMTATLLRRLDRLSSWTQIVLGVAVVTTAAPIATGLAVACVATYQLVCQPGVEAAKAAASQERWRALFRTMNSKSDNELAEAIQVTEEHDSPAIGGLRLPAQRAASVQLDLNAAALPRLSRWQKALAFLAGGLGEV
jgi:hypothetical protein